MIDAQQAKRAATWRFGTIVRIVAQSSRAKSFVLRLDEPMLFTPGQHVDIRLTAPDGYQAQRSYSIASIPGDDLIELCIELIPDGEVSPFFHDIARVSDRIEMRGPIGGPFTWSGNSDQPLLLVGGGSGIVPLMSMLRQQQSKAPQVPTLMLYSTRSIDDVLFRTELDSTGDDDSRVFVIHTLTRHQPESWNGYARRVDESMLMAELKRLPELPLAYVCGPGGFVETAADALVALGMPATTIRTERFGPTSG